MSVENKPGIARKVDNAGYWSPEARAQRHAFAERRRIENMTSFQVEGKVVVHNGYGEITDAVDARHLPPTQGEVFVFRPQPNVERRPNA